MSQNYLLNLLSIILIPSCIFYCTTGAGRVNSNILETIFRKFYKYKIPVFCICTNMNSLSENEFNGIYHEHIKLISSIIEFKPELICQNTYKFGINDFFYYVLILSNLIVHVQVLAILLKILIF